jgi:hypothetical protein
MAFDRRRKHRTRDARNLTLDELIEDKQMEAQVEAIRAFQIEKKNARKNARKGRSAAATPATSIPDSFRMTIPALNAVGPSMIPGAQPAPTRSIPTFGELTEDEVRAMSYLRAMNDAIDKGRPGLPGAQPAPTAVPTAVPTEPLDISWSQVPPADSSPSPFNRRILDIPILGSPEDVNGRSATPAKGRSATPAKGRSDAPARGWSDAPKTREQKDQALLDQGFTPEDLLRLKRARLGGAAEVGEGWPFKGGMPVKPRLPSDTVRRAWSRPAPEHNWWDGSSGQGLWTPPTELDARMREQWLANMGDAREPAAQTIAAQVEVEQALGQDGPWTKIHSPTGGSIEFPVGEGGNLSEQTLGRFATGRSTHPNIPGTDRAIEQMVQPGPDQGFIPDWAQGGAIRPELLEAAATRLYNENTANQPRLLPGSPEPQRGRIPISQLETQFLNPEKVGSQYVDLTISDAVKRVEEKRIARSMEMQASMRQARGGRKRARERAEKAEQRKLKLADDKLDRGLRKSPDAKLQDFRDHEVRLENIKKDAKVTVARMNLTVELAKLSPANVIELARLKKETELVTGAKVGDEIKLQKHKRFFAEPEVQLWLSLPNNAEWEDYRGSEKGLFGVKVVGPESFRRAVRVGRLKYNLYREEAELAPIGPEREAQILK